jgi:hypothetical protein
MTASANVTARGMSRAGWRNSLAICAIASHPTNSHIKMLAAVPTAHQPWGANGRQWWVTRDGRATLTATAMATTRAAERANWKPDETRRPRAAPSQDRGGPSRLGGQRRHNSTPGPTRAPT